MRTPEIYTVTLRPCRGETFTVMFAGVDSGQVLYAAMEIYPGCEVVRLCREGQWDSADDRAAADHAAPR
jgi:hypothetical protein